MVDAKTRAEIIEEIRARLNKNPDDPQVVFTEAEQVIVKEIIARKMKGAPVIVDPTTESTGTTESGTPKDEPTKEPAQDSSGGYPHAGLAGAGQGAPAGSVVQLTSDASPGTPAGPNQLVPGVQSATIPPVSNPVDSAISEVQTFLAREAAIAAGHTIADAVFGFVRRPRRETGYSRWGRFLGPSDGARQPERPAPLPPPALPAPAVAAAVRPAATVTGTPEMRAVETTGLISGYIPKQANEDRGAIAPPEETAMTVVPPEPIEVYDGGRDPTSGASVFVPQRRRPVEEGSG